MAGVYIGIAGLIYLSIEQPIIGALFFSFGLLVILSRGYYLYTGKVGYLIPYEKGYMVMLLKTLMGNMLGIVLVARLFVLTGVSEVITRGSDLYQLKLDNLWYQTFILSIFCGMMMYIAVDSYRKAKLDSLKVLLVIMPVAIFILAKFEHSIANMLYLFLGDTYTIKSFLWLFLMVIGNGVGGVLLNVTETKLDQNKI
ncbi:MAG: formate/nitrite transporter family protein, partial [Acholeplasmataceae bacterium]|jgi:nitrite transporter NirC|nr:formate/nitrite transporter family protein [Acholeplasmataceae bacterium]